MWDQHFPSVYYYSEYVLQRENKSCFIFLGALQSPWHLFKMRLKRHAAVKKKEANFSVTHWVIESLQAQWPALVWNISRVYPIWNDKKKKEYNMGKFNSITMCTYFLNRRIGFGFMIYLYQHTSEWEDSVFPLHNVCVLYKPSPAWHIIGSSEPWAYF